MGELWIMFQKELMDVLRDRRLLTAIVLPLIIIPVLFGIVQSSSHSTRVAVGIIDNDGGEYSRALVAFLERNGINVDESSPVTLVIPAGFSDAIKKGGSPELLIEARLSSPLDFKAVRSVEVLKGLILRFGSGVLPSIKPRFLMEVGGNVLNVEPSRYVSSLLKSSLAVPLVLFVIAIYASQAIAASVAMEKEGKTLETLLTLPVSRRLIILGKVFGSIAFSVLVLVSLAVSFGIFARLAPHSGSPQGVSVGLAPLLFLSAGIFLLFLLMLLTSLLVSLFTLDVRSALSIAGLVEVLYLIPMMVLFAGVEVSGLAGLLMEANPGYAPIHAFLSAMAGDYPSALGALLYLIAWNVLILRLTVWVFDNGILVSANINLEKLRWLVRVKI
ncbi:ABC transporter permease [Thermococcus indicus]|uniref:ABC transporter permease n=1 Tax=Thermococcus indicus TaxID=2586643 RepID=A0A4Y5SJV1_9EURY|nr:ABC transporter permease subunit [Thermococcus indicus]QDA30664.1 ABC transporter permease [Thermococcus indicus]